MSLINTIISWIKANYSPGLIVGISIGGIVLGILFILLVIACIRIEKLADESSHSPIKIIIIAVAPVVASLCALFNFDINNNLIFIIMAIACVAVFIWNMLTFRTIYAVMFTIVHVVAGFLAGMSFVAIVMLAILFGAVYLFGGFTGGLGSAQASGGVPSSVYDVNTSESFNVRQELNGNLTAYGHGREVLIRPVGGGRYIDDYGHDYVDYYSE